jgi:hypothetical protein
MMVGQHRWRGYAAEAIRARRHVALLPWLAMLP